MKTDDVSDLMFEMVRHNGVACATVKDGHVLMFDRSWLRTLLEKNNDAETLTIFVKREVDAN